MKRRRLVATFSIVPLVFWCALLATGWCHDGTGNAANQPARASLIVVLDGLRPDYLTPELMPNLHTLGAQGVVCEDHHSVFPTVTRVNSASISTGSYPGTHGLMGNSVFFPEISPVRGLSTGDAANLMRIQETTRGRLLTTPSLGELFERAGKKLLATSSGSTGSAFLLNHTVSGSGLINTEFVRPKPLETNVLEVLGPIPPDAEPNRERNRRAVDAYLEIGLKVLHPDVTIIWLSDPDHTAHGAGVGAPPTLESIRLVDGEIGRIVETLEVRGLKDEVNIFVVSDHGFSTHTGGANPAKLLVENGIKASHSSDDVVLVDGAIYVKNHDLETIRKIVVLLQKTDWVGPIFTRASSPSESEGTIPGTLSFHTIHWDHDRAADVLVSAAWSDAKNEYGYPGTTTLPGVAGHGTSSPYDIHATLVAAGPDIKPGMRSRVPTGNVDLAPTICHLHGIEPPRSMDGRVLKELLRNGPDPLSVPTERKTHRAQADWPGGSYRLELSESVVEGKRYVNYTTVERKVGLE